MNRSIENEHSRLWLWKAKQAIRGWSMQPDAVQKRNKPFECRVILLGALRFRVGYHVKIGKIPANFRSKTRIVKNKNENF